MIKNINLLIFIGLISPATAIAIQPVAHASTAFCNQTAFPVKVAYARGTFDPRPSIEIINYNIKGWLMIDPGACATASTELANKVALLDGYALVRHYYHAKFANTNLSLIDEKFAQVEKFCVRDIDFQYMGGIDITALKPKCSQGYKQIKFSAFNSTEPNHTILLNNSQNPPLQTKIKSFVEWCESKKFISLTTKKTINILLKKATTNSCKLADKKLNNLTKLELIGNKIVDLRPLASLKNLTTLFLEDNQILDVLPLANLTNLIHLRLGVNQIVDVKPLANLTRLEQLSLHNNQIRDIKPWLTDKTLTSPI